MGEPAPDTTQDSTPVTVNGVSSELLQSFVDRIEQKETEKQGVTEDMKLIYQEAKTEGFNTKILRKIIKIRATDADELQKDELLTAVYMEALGMTIDDG